MKKYIGFNAKKQLNAANDFEKYFLKLMINSVYGKTTENLRKKISVGLVTNEKGFLKYTSKPTHIAHKMLDKNVAAIHEIKSVLILNKTIYVGFTVLELSKWLMYKFHYNFIKKNSDAELLFTNTDSPTYEVKWEDFYDEFFKWKELFDFSNYLEDSKFLMILIKKLLEKWKMNLVELL